MTVVELARPADDEFIVDWDDADPSDRECVVCSALLDFDDRNPCDECTGLDGCPDDMCHGQGYCMHKVGAWRP